VRACHFPHLDANTLMMGQCVEVYDIATFMVVVGVRWKGVVQVSVHYPCPVDSDTADLAYQIS
jgi:hypothetical protein